LHWGRTRLSSCNVLISCSEIAFLLPNIRFFGAKTGIIALLDFKMLKGTKNHQVICNKAFFGPKKAIIDQLSKQKKLIFIEILNS
jgi:hypothetical protein